MSHPFDRLPTAVPLADAGDLLDGGHVWLHEYPDGTPLRFRLRSSGLLQVAYPVEVGEERRWRRAAGTNVPPRFGFAVRALQRQLDRAALRAAVEDPTEVAFGCVAVHRRRLGYDWDRAPPVVGLSVAHPGSSFLPHELQRLFDGVGVPPAPTIEAEVHTRSLDATGVDLPESAWRDGPALGVLYRGKPDGLALQLDSPESTVEEVSETGADYAERRVTSERIEAAAAAVADDGREPTVDAVAEWLFDRAVRDDFPTLTGDAVEFDLDDLRSAITARVAELRGRGE